MGDLQFCHVHFPSLFVPSGVPNTSSGHCCAMMSGFQSQNTWKLGFWEMDKYESPFRYLFWAVPGLYLYLCRYLVWEARALPICDSGPLDAGREGAEPSALRPCWCIFPVVLLQCMGAPRLL